ncbi:MAG: branched-chain amino acid ABC transporter substrate-binding protein [Deltaproteobacteria bacterium]|nr:branched-chain amino acid ABC transporter substrate-binding protein [Deltaproteobacteria bacterium]
MTRKWFSMVVVCAVTRLFLAGQSFAADEIKVGIMVPTTGVEAAFGKDMENAILLAVSEINAKGGILGRNVITTSSDEACDPQQASSAASKLVSEDVVAVVGGYCSPATAPTLKIYGDAGVPIVIPAANSTTLITANPGNGFQIINTGFDQVITAVNLFKEKKIRKLAIIHQKDSYSTELAVLTEKKWKAMGLEVVAVEVANKGEQNHAALVARLKSKAPDAVFWTAYYDDGPLVIKQLRQGGFNKLIAVGDGSNSPKLMENAGKAAEGVYCFSKPMIEYLPGAKAFVESYRKKFNQEPGPYSALSYDAMNLLSDAITRAGVTDKAAIAKALKETKEFKGIAGPISFKSDNTLARSNFVVLIAKGNNWTLYK